MAAHRRQLRIYLEDTDAQGVVYHTNYLKYCERSRTDILMAQGFRLSDLQDRGFTLVVHEMKVKYRRPARLHDEVEILTRARRGSEFRITFEHEVRKVGESAPLVTAEVQVVAVGVDGDLASIPDSMLAEPVA